MKTLLDNGDSWLLEKLVYENELSLFLRELKKGKPTNLQIGEKTLTGVSPLKKENNCRLVKVRFDWLLSWQCLNESATSGFQNDTYADEGFISILKESVYLSHILEQYGWYEDIQETKATHYRIWTENEIIDVISFSEPTIEDSQVTHATLGN